MNFKLTEKGAVLFFGREGDLYKPLDDREKDIFLKEDLIECDHCL